LVRQDPNNSITVIVVGMDKGSTEFQLSAGLVIRNSGKKIFHDQTAEQIERDLLIAPGVHDALEWKHILEQEVEGKRLNCPFWCPKKLFRGAR
jgi:hypothetical protein